jgi:hypothetical protein
LATWQRGKHAALLHKGIAAHDCTHGTCNPVNFTVLKPSDWTWGYVIGIRIDKKGLDLGSLVDLRLKTVKKCNLNNCCLQINDKKRL